MRIRHHHTNIVFTVLGLLCTFQRATLCAQQSSLTLEYCQQKARENYPLLKQKDFLKQSNELSLENIEKIYLPVFNAGAQATYQSSVVEIPFQIPGVEIPEFPKDHYQLTLDVMENIYDGGTAHGQKLIQEAGSDAEQQKVDVQLYNLRQQVNSTYFAILMGEKTLEQLQLNRQDLQKKYDQVYAGVKNGAVLQSNADQVKAEILKTDQRITEVTSQKSSYVKTLGILINESLNEQDLILEIPNAEAQLPAYDITKRPDLILLQKQQFSLEAMKALTKTHSSPKLGAFVQLGYSRPALDPFSTEFEPYYLAGLKLSWNLWNWNSSKNERQVYTVQQEMIQKQIETLDMNTKVTAMQQQGEIEKLKTLITQDQEMIDIRKKISKTTSDQLDNGVITVTDYLSQVNAQYIAELSMSMHQLQLVYAYVNYVTTLGR